MKTKFGWMILLTLTCLSAQAADKGLNGGDVCEARFKEIRDDLSSWIHRGGASQLKLPNGVSVTEYATKMTHAISKAQVNCVDDRVVVDHREKTCKNFVDSSGSPQIVCNNQRMLKTSATAQYVLVHHEYAGLAGFEVNDEDGSHYSISNQLSDHLTDQVVKKLAVRGTEPIDAPILTLVATQIATNGTIYDSPGNSDSDSGGVPVISEDGEPMGLGMFVKFPGGEVFRVWVKTCPAFVSPSDVKTCASIGLISMTAQFPRSYIPGSQANLLMKMFSQASNQCPITFKINSATRHVVGIKPQCKLVDETQVPPPVIEN